MWIAGKTVHSGVRTISTEEYLKLKERLGTRTPQQQRDPREALSLGRTIKTTGIAFLKPQPDKGPDWWVCRCPCGGEFVAHGWNVRHGRTRNCGSDEHTAQPKPILKIDMACEPGREAMAGYMRKEIHFRSACFANTTTLSAIPASLTS